MRKKYKKKKHDSTNSEKNAAIIKRFNKTLKEQCTKCFTEEVPPYGTMCYLTWYMNTTINSI